MRRFTRRRSVRRYETRPVAREALVRLVETGCWAPSAGNMQTWKFVILTDEQNLRKLRMVSPGLIGDPPASIVVCEDVAESERRAGEVGAAMATNMDAAMAALRYMSAGARRRTRHLPGGLVSRRSRGAADPPARGSGAEAHRVGGLPAPIPKAPHRRPRGIYFFEAYDGCHEKRARLMKTYRSWPASWW